MGLTTDFNQSPYFDDFDETKNYHKVLFKPSVALQARELTQLQTILQNQIERFGDNVLIEGTIVQGGNFVEEDRLPYVKVRDIAFNTSGGEVSTDVALYTDMKAIGLTTNVEGVVIATEFGLESQTPNLNTLFVRYTKTAITANTNVLTFSNTEEIQLYAKDANGDYTIPFHRLTVAGLADPLPIGNGYGVRCGEGVIYQKGNFIKFADGLTIVSKYSNAPDDVVVGFQTIEEIVDSNADVSLLDNANGFNNENAPGADRLRLTPKLVVKTIAQAAADESFFAIQEYSRGRIARRKISTQYSAIEQEMEKRTIEESGNYVVSRFPVRVEQSTSNTSNLSVIIGAGLGYVEGRRVELLNDIDLEIPEASTFIESSQQDINTNYGSYLIVNTMLGKFDFTAFETINLRNAGGTTIGTARVRSITRESATEYRLYIFMIKMLSGFSFENTRTVIGSGGATAIAVLVNSKAVLTDGSFARSFFPIGKSFIRSVNALQTDFVYRTNTTQTITTASLVITLAAAGDTFPYTLGSSLNTVEREDLMIVAGAAIGTIANGEVLTAAAASLDGTGKVLTITLNKNPGGALSVTSYYNVKRSSATINQKTLETIYVRINANTNTNGITGNYCLGVPDAYSIEGVWKVANTVLDATLQTYATSNSNVGNVTGSFRLNTGQFDDHYALSYITKSADIVIGTNDKLIAKVKVFKKDTQPGHFFTVDSYPVDDATSVLPADKIRTEYIPTYTADNGLTYYLRDVIDLRPHASNTAVYAVTAATATLNPSNATTFANVLFPAPNETIETTYSYYLGRNDIVMIDKNGEFSTILGTPSENPSYPPEPSKGMILARLYVPPYPSLPGNIANNIGRRDYGVGISSNQTRRYTMKDIRGIEQRLDNIEYYTSLSLLETSAKDFLITDSNGLDRFKNGIFVDNFDNLYLSDVNGGEFGAAIDYGRGEVHPTIRQYPLNLKVKSLTNATNHGKTAVTLIPTDVLMKSVSQPYGTNLKSCTTSFYKYNGIMEITPEYDSGPDTIKAPDININIDLATPFVEYTKNLASIIPMVSSEVSQRQVGGFFGALMGLPVQTTTVTTTKNLQVTAGPAEVKKVGDFVTKVEFSPWIRSRDIQIHVDGLRPNTRFYFFFDKVSIDQYVTTGSRTGTGATATIKRTSLPGAKIITSNSVGELNAVFRIPAGTFYVGDRALEILDVPNLDDRDAATSSASSIYSAYNFSSTQTSVSTVTRPPKLNVLQTSVSRTVMTPANNRRIDPIAQTFIVDADLSSDTNVFLTKIDLFFAKKSREGKGVTVQLREVENGYPSGIILPFSSIHLTASQVNAPTSAPGTSALTPTTVTFKAPVAVKTDTEYAVVVIPDGNDPDYLMWISRTGETDVDSGIAITQDTNAGVLFTSTNNKAWTAYQNENLKFNLYAAKFNTTSGSVTLTNNDNEFFDITNFSGTFETSESIFIDKTAYLSGVVSIIEGSTTLSGVGTSFTTNYNAGDHIVVKINASTYEVLQIKTIVSNTSMILEDTPKRTATAIATHYTSPVGTLTYITTSTSALMILEASTAKSSTFKFTNADSIRGENSGATATITTVKSLPISYIQPAIYRTDFTKTKTDLVATKLFDGVSEATQKNIAFNDTNYLSDKPYYIKSKSTDFLSSGFELTVAMQNTDPNSPDTSPVIDYEISSAMVAEYYVNSLLSTDITETTSIGAARAKYVSKKVELADGGDAEDIRVIIAAYKPVGSDIRVYAKFHSSTDIRAFRDVEWTQMVIKAETDVTSSNANRYDYHEYAYALGTTALTAGAGAWDNNGTINYIDDAGAIYTNYKYFAIKIVMLSGTHNIVPRIKDLRAIALT